MIWDCSQDSLFPTDSLNGKPICTNLSKKSEWEQKSKDVSDMLALDDEMTASILQRHVAINTFILAQGKAENKE